MNSEARHFTVGLFVLVQVSVHLCFVLDSSLILKQLQVLKSSLFLQIWRSSVEKIGMQQLQSSLIGTARLGGSSAFIGKVKR